MSVSVEGRSAQRRPSRWVGVARLLRSLVADGPGALGLAVLLFVLALSIVGPGLAPFAPYELQYLPDGSLARGLPPSSDFWLGTTSSGRDVMSQVLIGARAAVIVGGLSALATVFIGTNVALWAGYKGGRVDDALMRIVDVTYGIPFLPFAIILVSLLGPSIWNMIFIIAILFWRTTARVIRAQVLSLRERPFVVSARAAGASSFHIVYRHLLPNVLPLVLLYTALAIGNGVAIEAGLSFLGFGDRSTPSWGTMLREAFDAGAVRRAWWWVVPPGVAITLFGLASFLVGRSLEVLTDPRLRKGH